MVLRPADLTPLYAKRAGLVEIFMGGSMQKREIQGFSQRLEEERRQSFHHKSANDILALHESNFEILYAQIERVGINDGILGATLQFDFKRVVGETKKIRFQLKSKQIEHLREVLTRTMPEKTSQLASR